MSANLVPRAATAAHGRGLAPILVAAFAAAAAAAQNPIQFSELDKFKVPGATTSLCVAAGDVNGDGRIDVVFGRNGADQLYLNNGKGQFTAGNLPGGADNTLSVALGDVDGDRDLDIVFGNGPAQQNRLLRNDGGGSFTDVTATNMPADADRTRGLALVDVDGDLDLDLVCANGGTDVSQQSKLYLNNGAGVFTHAAGRLPTATSTAYAVAAGDVDGDRDADLVIANIGTSFAPTASFLYRNDGSGNFSDATPQLPATNSQYAASVALGDVDGDLDLDIHLGNLASGPLGTDSLWLNNGSGTFTDVSATNLVADNGHGEGNGLGDVDSDGDLDIITVNRFEPPILYVNDGTGVFSEPPRMPLLFDSVTGMTMADLDGDRDLDFVASTNGSPDRFMFNLYHQMHAPNPARVGMPYALDVHARPGFAAINVPAAPFLSLQELPVDFVIEPFGAFRLNPLAMFALPPITILVPGGSFRINLTVPGDTGLIGQPVFTQAFVIHGIDPATWRLTNLMPDTIGA
jgi:hypothetical protein